jgi:ABC-type multidrug transport system fused ATPase/permease subunit
MANRDAQSQGLPLMLRRLLPYWRTARLETLAGGVLLFFGAFVDLLQPWPIKWLVDYVFGNQAAPLWLSNIWPSLSGGNAAAGITAVCVSIFVLGLIHRGFVTIGHFFLIRAGAHIVQQLRCTACDHLHALSIAFHDRTKVGDSMYRIAHDSQAAQAMLNGALVPSATGALILSGAVVIMTAMNPLLTLTTLAVTPLFVVIIRGFSRRIEKQSQKYHEHESKLASTLQETLSSIRAIKAFTLEPQAGERFRVQSEQSLDANQRMTRTQLVYSACAGLAVSIGTAAVVWVAAHQVLRRSLSVGDILIFLAYLGMLYQPMNTFSQSASVIHSASAQLRRVFEIIDSMPEIRSRSNAITPRSIQGDVEFCNVSFEYQPERPILSRLSLHAEPGKVIAIVGRTGAGKTTIASLLLRFYDPTSGAVWLDGHDLRDLDLAWLRHQVSVVLQDPVLFSTTIRENIGYGLANATPEEIQKAAQRAQADEFILKIPEGYGAMIGERGVNLSGGQRQRLSIARAFLKNAPILILDEPTSALDTHTEEALLTALKELMAGRTTFIIAHRLSTIRQADLIVVLENGIIAEQGDHAALIGRDGLYARMYQSQWGCKSLEPHLLVS